MDDNSEKSERDINDIFDDITLIEQQYSESSYREGYEIGINSANYQGYRLGYEQGQRIGKELAEIYGTIIAIEQSDHSKPNICRLLQELRNDIEEFPTTNVDNVDISGGLTKLRLKYKRLCCLLNLPVSSKADLGSTSNFKGNLNF